MTNLQQSREARDAGFSPETLKSLWLWGPIGVGGVLAAVLLLALALPQWLAISRDQKRLDELERQRAEIELLKLQTLKVLRQRQDAQRQQRQLIQLVTGKGDGSTYLATLDLEARQSDVRLQLFEPTPPPEEGTPGAKGNANSPNRAQGAPPGAPGATPPANDGKGETPPTDPLRQAGLESRPVLLSARGSYPKILDFLRRMELLDLLAEHKVLTLSLPGVEPGQAPQPTNEPPPPVQEVEVKVALTLYSKNKGEETEEKPVAAKR
ncbi:MAG: hypothetical protein ACK41W_14575 [Cyanobacteriota bacterium]|jgi:type IV pilus assembly protein PilO